MVLFENQVPFFNQPVSNIPSSFKRRLVLVKMQLTKQKTKTKNNNLVIFLNKKLKQYSYINISGISSILLFSACTYT